MRDILLKISHKADLNATSHRITRSNSAGFAFYCGSFSANGIFDLMALTGHLQLPHKHRMFLNVTIKNKCPLQRKRTGYSLLTFLLH